MIYIKIAIIASLSIMAVIGDNDMKAHECKFPTETACKKL